MKKTKKTVTTTEETLTLTLTQDDVLKALLRYYKLPKGTCVEFVFCGGDCEAVFTGAVARRTVVKTR